MSSPSKFVHELMSYKSWSDSVEPKVKKGPTAPDETRELLYGYATAANPEKVGKIVKAFFDDVDYFAQKKRYDRIDSLFSLRFILLQPAISVGHGMFFAWCVLSFVIQWHLSEEEKYLDDQKRKVLQRALFHLRSNMPEMSHLPPVEQAQISALARRIYLENKAK